MDCSSPSGYAPICLGLEDFYIRRLYLRIQDCFGRPISSAPDAWFDVVERFSNDNNKTLKRTTKISKCLNLGSYNYLGFAASDEFCTPRVIESLKRFSPGTCSTRVDGGTTTLHKEVEECVANFVGKPAAIVFGMGYVTNSAILPVLIGKGGLIISDSLNHNSIVNGARGSGATVRVFQHNIPSHLEKVLREQIAEGQPRTHRPWKKIIVVVEGIYSMEGELCKLPEIVAICKKYKVCSSTQKNLQSSGACYRYASMTYKAYVYLDEAHSIGAVGKTGRGVCELLGVDTADVDIMMGTFTKSFGSCGGYIAGSKRYMVSSLEPHHPHPNLLPPKPGFRGLLRISVSIPDECALNSLFNEVLNLNQVALVWEGDWLRFYRATLPKYNNQGDGLNELIQYLKYTCPAHLYATSISPPAAQQIISSIKVILGEDGSSRGAQKLARIRENSNFFRSELQKMGFEVLGDNDSPVMPIMLYNPAKIPAFSRECLKQNVAVVTVAFPATPLLLARARICISASHTREDLIKGLEVISRVGDLVAIKYFPAEPRKQQLEEGRVKLE
ncbi:Long chain base biosynthesis protein 2a [Vitis vinifera]|uniref:serine C-palmitoyltransferase n=1 Tax=Vitis vinifera TaxID=29760 RepID=A0A438K9Q2_VITVI|nr:Long chain base biosynthesis protein 2a [Vitis vinifera]